MSTTSDISAQLLENEEDLVTVFMGDLYNCRERLNILEEHEISSIITGELEGIQDDLGAPTLSLQIKREDLEQVITIFNEVWEEILEVEGIEDAEASVLDFSADVIVCPGCQTETDEVTEDGECPECGLFLGFPEDFDPTNQTDEETEEIEEISEEENPIK